RVFHVTGVQTCALPISMTERGYAFIFIMDNARRVGFIGEQVTQKGFPTRRKGSKLRGERSGIQDVTKVDHRDRQHNDETRRGIQTGRASGRERSSYAGA